MKFLFILVLSFSVLAKLPIADIKNFNGNYADPTGQAQSTKFLYEDISFEENASFVVEKQAGSFFLQTPNEEIQIENIPSFVNNLEKLKWAGINLSSNSSLFNLSIDSLSGKNNERSLSVRNFSINCKSQNNYENIMSDILDSCLNVSGNLDLDSVVLNSVNKKETKVENLNIDIRSNSVDFRVKASGFNVKGDGKVYFEEDKVRVRIDKAKAGFLNVKGILFKELDKMESQNVKVNRPWITIYLNQ